VDFAFTDPAGRLKIFDWKTGIEKADALQLQLACYSLYATDKWHVPLESIEVAGVFLGDGARVSHYPVGPDVLTETKDKILTSAAAMREVLVDPLANVAAEEDFPLAEKDWPCRNCSFRAACPKHT